MEVDMAKWVLPDDDGLTKVSQAMKKHGLTVHEVLSAIHFYVNDRDFQKALDEHYNNLVDDSWEYWHDGDL
jgi:purine-nucleoside phosphorylase